jgi:hypothetical protein
MTGRQHEANYEISPAVTDRLSSWIQKVCFDIFSERQLQIDFTPRAHNSNN